MTIGGVAFAKLGRCKGWPSFRDAAIRARDAGRESDWKKMFKRQSSHGDTSRRQKPCPSCIGVLRALLEEVGVLPPGSKGAEWTLELALIRSTRQKSHCVDSGDGQQSWHIDMCRSILISISGDSTLLARQQDAGFISMPDAGDAVVFGPKFVHAGAGYTKLNYRLHAYIMGPKDVAPGNLTGDVTDPVVDEAQSLLQEFTPSFFSGWQF